LEDITGFDFYENLRYILPGYFVLFLTAPLFITEYWTNLDLTEKIMYGFILGFFLHSFDLYKLVPGFSNMKKEHLMKFEKLTGRKPNHVLQDVMSFTFAEEKQLFKRYYGFGALKLDIAAILIFTVILKVYTIITKWAEIQQNSATLVSNFVFVFAFIIVGYVVRKDGIQDIKRAFNIELFVVVRSLKENSGGIKEILSVEKENMNIFFRDD
jgi:hypothetical protein